MTRGADGHARAERAGGADGAADIGGGVGLEVHAAIDGRRPRNSSAEPRRVWVAARRANQGSLPDAVARRLGEGLGTMLRTRPTLLIAIAFLLITAGTATAATKVLIKSRASGQERLARRRRPLRQGPQGPAGQRGPGRSGRPRRSRRVRPAPPARAARPKSSSPGPRGINTPSCPADGCDPGADPAHARRAGRQLPDHRLRGARRRRRSSPNASQPRVPPRRARTPARSSAPLHLHRAGATPAPTIRRSR